MLKAMKKTTTLLLDETTIQARIAVMSADLAREYRGHELAVIGILTGCFMFLADLIRCMHHDGILVRLDFMILGSYKSTESTGRVNLVKDSTLDVRGQPVLLVDDILDTGRTLQTASALLRDKGASRVTTCVLLDKPARRAVPFEAEYAGFAIENRFVVGYGLDYNGLYRELPYIATMD